MKLQFFITSRARLEFSYFFTFSVWVNYSLSSMFTIIRHEKGKVLSFFLLKVVVYETSAQFPVYLLVYRRRSIFFLKQLSQRMDLMFRGSEKYFE